MHHQRGSLVPIGDAVSELDGPVPDEKFALELRCFIREQLLIVSQCLLNS